MTPTKIVATIGPATATPEMLRRLSEFGMSIARLNGSHADLDWHRDAIKLIRDTLPQTPILLDIPGRKVRTIQLAHEPSFSAGDTLILTTDTVHDGTEKVPVNYANLHKDVEPGTTILADDGTLRFTVMEINGPDIVCRADVNGTLRSRKGINVPNVRLGTDLITQRDHDMVAFARDNEVDFIGISFVESAAHVEAIRSLTGGTWPRIVAKVENQGGIDNLEEICSATDAIMIDRGDLSVETNLETLAIAQKKIIIAATAAAKPVIVATEILHSMIENPFPTKAEVSDITNAVIDGCAATMLSGETAVGKHPIQAVEMMQNVAKAASSHVQSVLDYDTPDDKKAVPKAVDAAIALICRQLAISKIVAVTVSGYAARLVASHRPSQPILAISNDPIAARSFNLLYGTEGFFIDIPFPKSSTDHVVHCLEHLWRIGKLVDDDLVLVTAVGYPNTGNRMNLIQTHYISDLKQVFDWQP
ncbi:pyruvate kinase [bacterium SCSIO 12827]|nr:pyruvate kinase [bacterium SCSIO 12827]